MKIQATSIALNGWAYLITGAPGSGKSSLALALIHRGASLIADDVTEVQDDFAVSPRDYRSCLEVRGIGLVSGFPVCDRAPIAAEIRLTNDKPERLPISGQRDIPCFDIWTQDQNAADKVMVIDDMLSGKLNIRKEDK